MAKPAPSPLINREIGILAFNRRVLAQAQDPAIPPLERLRYLCIVASNLDEFFETRVAQLQDLLEHEPAALTPDGLPVAEALRLIADDTHALVAEKYRVLQQAIYPMLRDVGVRFVTSGEWSPRQQRWARSYFEREVLPVLTPIGLDPAHPFPKVLNKSLNFAVMLEGTDAFGRNVDLGIIQAPRALPRVLEMPQDLVEDDKLHSFVLLSSLMQAYAGHLFPGLKVQGVHQFRVTRNSELFVDDDEITNLRTALQGELRARHYGDAVRLEVTSACPQPLLERLMRENGLHARDCFRVDGPVNLARLQSVIDMLPQSRLTYPPHLPAALPGWPGAEPELFERIRAGDVLLHHPYDSFAPVVDLVRTAARDPQVLAIKQTIYRAGHTSDLMEALIEASRNGKEVTVVLELMARLDEETNINWAARLEAEGAHVVYGVVGFKCHAKMLMVVRRERTGRRTEQLRRYVHLGTGNYHTRTARLYTDFGLMTADEAICADVNQVFLEITGSSRFAPLRRLWQSPFSLLDKLIRSIRHEARLARAGKPARIWARVNALLEPTVIGELYKAARAGVEIRLLVRGPCMLRPGIAGLSENIRVRSVIGRFLEHARVFYFHNDGAEDVWISSADWMERNLFRRVEIAAPILDPEAKAKVIREGLRVHWTNPGNAWDMDGAGNWRRARGWQRGRSSHQVLIDSREPETP
ncbi:polyphosphate kinase 1 [Thiomonas sp. FB-6]|uniref:polyphosphate kinase 1 n=1 Tax=Thiomonas sp. FB-6 TaxID=1158291 RepID=UPI00036B34A6|nr:polyphosphate kinase 1 [Thiomonas sp. FB-6]